MKIHRATILQLIGFVLATLAATGILVAAGMAEEPGSRQGAECLFCK